MGRNTLELVEGALGVHTSHLGLETYFLFFKKMTFIGAEEVAQF